MFRCSLIVIVLVLALSCNAFPADAPVTVELTADAADLVKSATAAAADDNDLQGSETFGFGYYPGFHGGYGGGYGAGYGGFGHFGGYGGYNRRWGYGYDSHGYGGYGGYHHRPIYPVWG